MTKRTTLGASFLLLCGTTILGACGGDVEREQPPGRAQQRLGPEALSTCTTTNQQNAPAISGTRVVWMNASTSNGSNFDLYLLDLSSTNAAVDLTNTPSDQEFLQDISGDQLVFTHTSTTIPGDIQVHDFAAGQTTTIASSTQAVHFEQPSISGNIVVFLRVTATQNDVYAYDLSTGPLGLVTNDAATQGRPRTDGTWVVYEDYASGASVATAARLPSGAPFAMGAGSTPDVDGGVVVYTGKDAAGSDQLFLFDTATSTTTQLTTATSSKILPRISGGHIVWSDDRAGNLDVYGYDLATRTEVQVATGTGDQFLADVDGDRVVYTTNETGCEAVALVGFPVVSPPPTVESASDDVRTWFEAGDVKNQGLENALLSKLAAAAARRAAGDCAGAATIYQAFIDFVNAQAGKGISDAAAAALVADAQYLVDHCP